MDAAAGASVSLLVPTLNRPEFVARLLRYYRTVGFGGQILIGDSSAADSLAATRRSIKEVGDGLNVTHVACPAGNVSAVFRELSDLVTTPFVAHVQDDDFLVPSTLQRAARVLDSHPDCVAAHGLAVCFALDSAGAHGSMTAAWPYRLQVVGAETAAGRVVQHLTRYAAALFSLHRIETWREMFRAVDVADRAFRDELLPSCLSVVAGKTRHVDGLYLVRHIHQQRYTLPTLLDWVTDETWQPSYMAFREHIAGAVARTDAISIDAARAAVTEGFGAYLAQGMWNKWRQASTPRPRWKDRAKRIPYAQAVWRRIAGRRRAAGVYLPGLLARRSRYNADFMPVYRSVIGSGATDASLEAAVVRRR